MKLEEIADLPAGPGQVVVSVKAAGVNPVDTYIRSGKYASLPPLPYTPGSDAAGIVESVGSDVHDFSAGDRVYISGTVDGRAYGSYAQTALCTIDQVHHSARRTCRSPKAPASASLRHRVARAVRQRARAIPARPC